VTYTFTASSPGTRAYYSGTQGDLQVEMACMERSSSCRTARRRMDPVPRTTLRPDSTPPALRWSRGRTRLPPVPTGAAYHLTQSCYDREYLFQFSEMDPNIHIQALAQVTLKGACTAGAAGCSLNVPTEPTTRSIT